MQFPYTGKPYVFRIATKTLITLSHTTGMCPEPDNQEDIFDL
jgi:hypothetical protein